MWMSSDVVYICGFAANREWADKLLSNQPPGTFLLRPSMAMVGTLVISVNTHREGQVIHLAIDSRQLAERSLEGGGWSLVVTPPPPPHLYPIPRCTGAFNLAVWSAGFATMV
jgi:hypothetical protein